MIIFLPGRGDDIDAFDRAGFIEILQQSNRAAELLSTVIPDSHMFSKDGHHLWKTWRSLWSDITKSPSWEYLGYTE